jgi:hypothetical protein
VLCEQQQVRPRAEPLTMQPEVMEHGCRHRSSVSVPGTSASSFRGTGECGWISFCIRLWMSLAKPILILPLSPACRK